jgi:hypothetical protein
VKQAVKEKSVGERPLYASAGYARAFGLSILDVPEWRTSVLTRSISGSEWKDAIGCYPLSLIDRKADLEGGLERLRVAELVSVSLVPDPVTGPRPEALRAAFPLCRLFKKHYLIDRKAGPVRFAGTHRRWIRKALRECDITAVSLRSSLADWERLYQQTIERHAISGIQRFSHHYFAALSETPSVQAFGARVDGGIVAMALWVRSPGVTYYHLGASNSRGREMQAMYGIFAVALELFANDCVVHLGGAAGISPSENNGLARFKRGFANREVDVYFCGACLQPERYAALTKGRPANSFFPAYRVPE